MLIGIFPGNSMYFETTLKHHESKGQKGSLSLAIIVLGTNETA